MISGLVVPTSRSVWARPMMRREKIAIENIYVRVKRRATLKPDTVREIAQSMLEVGQTTPILVRRDGERFVLVHGLHRLEACKGLGGETIFGDLVQAQKHYNRFTRSRTGGTSGCGASKFSDGKVTGGARWAGLPRK